VYIIIPYGHNTIYHSFFFQKSPVIRKNLNEQELDNIWDEKQLQILVSIIISKNSIDNLLVRLFNKCLII